MLPFNVPFLADDDYVDFLKRNEHRLQSVHYSLHDPLLQDARIQTEACSIERLEASLRQLKGVKKYVLANGRFHPDAVYGGGDRLKTLLGNLERLTQAGQLDGILFSDSYMLTALADNTPSLVNAIEAVPSVNFQIDSIHKLTVLMDFVQDNGFRPPGKVTLDRSLSRNPQKLTELKAAMKSCFKQLDLELLANEGCLPHCPYRATHEALISLANCRADGVDTRLLNNNLACVRRLSEAPFKILSSPFIRPEDVDFYQHKADVIKICGRTLGTVFLKKTISAYLQGSFHGNLFDLFDASHWMADLWDLPNHLLPDDFPLKMARCTYNCSGCSYCNSLFEKLAAIKPITIIDRRKS